MALQRSIDKATYAGLDTAIRALYVERDGKYVLDVDDSPVMSALEAERQRAKALEAKLAGYGEATPEQVKALADAKAKAEREANFASGNFEKILAETTAKHQKDLELATQAQTRLRASLQSALIDAEATRAIVEHGGNPALLLPIIKGRTKLESVGEQEVAVVIGEKGGPLLRAGAQKADDFMPIGEFVATMKADKTYAGAFASNAGSGSGGQRTNRATSPESVTARQRMERTVEALKNGATRIGADV